MLATPAIPLMTIEDDHSYRLETTVEESRISQIAIGQSARVRIDVMAGEITGRVDEIRPASDAASRTYTVKLSLDPPGASRIRSGLFGRASFAAGERDALIVSESAIVKRGQLTGVYVVEGDTALLRLVKTGKRFNNGVELLSGLQAGTRIVVSDTAEISDGARITEISQPEKS
jgi:RND family efflux transporter MFP subunit